MDDEFKLEANYHSHTYRCGHAVGTDEEYVRFALRKGLKAIGFSDHVILPGASQPGMRGDPSLLEGYISSVKSLKAKYRGEIDVLLAFECEWYRQEFASYYRDLLAEKGFDYLILGQHCFHENGRFTFYGEMSDREESLRKYTADVLDALDSGLFAYVAHPDLYVRWYRKWDALCEECAYLICRKAKQMNTPLEINMGPSRWARKSDPDDLSILIYPYPRFFQIAKEVGNQFVAGVDAHDPKEYLTSDYVWLNRFLEKLGIAPLKRVAFPKVK